MAAETSEKIDEYIKNMPSLSTTVSKVLEVCNNPQTSPADLNRVISLDPVLVGRVLKLINSAYYGLGQQVTSLVRAIIMLGINTVKNLALSSAVLGNLSAGKSGGGLNMEGFWRHSLCVGVAAKIIAKKRGVDPKQTEEYFTAGLLHDIGKIPLNAVLPAAYMLAIGESDRDKMSLIRAEDGKLGINHCEAGAKIVKAWKLEGAVGDAIIYHHNHIDYDGEHREVLNSVILANRFASLMEIGFSGDRYPEKPGPSVWEFLGINDAIFDEIEPVVNGEIEKAQVFLKL
ncbi:MAG: HDOD domain-containing protein [Treponema sp.]|jgi:putative nucleotidyltransferase with HDIG domain|nr:HDOD domain-containing protein [Treponema sp.]